MRSRKMISAVTTLLLSIWLMPAAYASSALTVNLPDPSEGTFMQDETTPDVTARVARISFLKGDVQIRHADSQDWEHAVLNLPIVEGDEITTGADSRIEIQFDSQKWMRLAENSDLVMTRLLDEGIAVSLPQGSLSLRVNKFDIDQAYFEMDAPGCTIAVQNAGNYRIDAGDQDNPEVRVTVTGNGEARIYSASSGFTLKSDESAAVLVTGNKAGEWETADAALYTDEFDNWSADRDVFIARSLQNSYYDKYYDSDIYGAEDLNNNGEWIYIKKYGYVWRPYSSAISSYADWSPYRYGVWRWIPPYGWTWVNDEPWGWATYHHGRWVFEDGNWYWSPYGQYRTSRSWWSPALVVIDIFNNNVCWYPLPYNYGYYNYNYYWNTHGGGWGGNNNHGGHHGGPLPTPTPGNTVGVLGPSFDRGIRPPLGTVPPTGVVSTTVDQFGRNGRGNRLPPLGIANTVLSKVPNERQSPPILPIYKDVKTHLGSDISVEKPRKRENLGIQTGAMTRKTDKPLDPELRTTRSIGGRPPIQVSVPPTEPVVVVPATKVPRKTGAVDRQPPILTPPVISDPPKKTEPVRQKPVYVPPTMDPPKKIEPVRQPPVYVPPVKQDPPKKDPPKQEPKPVTKPAPVKDEVTKKKDG